MRLHVPRLPFIPTPTCAYQGKVERFVTMMRARGHEVFDYQPSALDPARGWVPGSEWWMAANLEAQAGIMANGEAGDVLCLIGGRCQEPLAVALPSCWPVEFGIGYAGTFAPYRVFESYAWMHTVLGAQGTDRHDAFDVDGRFYDAVIPNYFDVDQFPEGTGQGDDRGPYLLYVGRLIDRKGHQIAEQVCERLGYRLVLAGEGENIPSYGEAVGVVGPADRARLMGGASAIFVPSRYVEPFGGVAVEAMLCGTPAITTDFGAFTETIDHGVTGFRCSTMGEFLTAAEACAAGQLDRTWIRHAAQRRWSLDAVAPLYDAYLARVVDLGRYSWGDPARPVAV